MLLIELKFTADTLVKCFNHVFRLQFNELDAITKHKFIKEKSHGLAQRKICNLRRQVGSEFARTL